MTQAQLQTAETQPQGLPYSLVADFGASGTKALVTDGTIVKLLFMTPEVADVPKTSIKMFEDDNFNSQSEPPENRAWFCLGQTCKAVGFLAERRFRATTSLTIPKFELALFKTLSLLWVTKEKFGLPNEFSIDLSLLLPPSEYNDRFKLEEMLGGAASEFETPSGKMSVNFSNFECKPEGAGVLMYLQSQPKLKLSQRTATLVMIGYRNASLISVKDGSVLDKVSTDLGMNYLINVIKNHVSIYIPLSVLLSVIEKAGFNILEASDETMEEQEEIFKILAPLVSTSTIMAIRSAQLEEIRNAIAVARLEYANALYSWINPLIPFNNDLMIFCGGTANYLSPELKKFSDLKGFEFLQDDFVKIPNKIDSMGLKERLTDLYCYFSLIYSKKWKRKKN
ncbi:MAG: ParM/StbA family protein [Cyanobacteria bacterium P01_F01_bin.143]